MAKILVKPKWLKLLTNDRATAMALFPFIIVRNEISMENEVLIRHEMIHLRQQAELGILPFYIWYLIEFLIRFVWLRNFQQAYLNISFEKEAYRNEEDPAYLSSRKMLNFVHFL